MKVDVKHAKDGGIRDGSSISIESGEDLVIAPGAEYVGIFTNNVPEYANNDELWIFKRKAFLKAVAKALDVMICERIDGEDLAAGYYR